MNLEFLDCLSEKTYQAYKPTIVDFVNKYIVKSRCWNGINRLKQPLTRETYVISELDLYRYFKELGFQVKVDETGTFLVKAKYNPKKRSELLSDLPDYRRRKKILEKQLRLLLEDSR